MHNLRLLERFQALQDLSAEDQEAVIKLIDAIDSLSVGLMDGRTISVPLVWYPRLLHADDKQRKNWKISGGGFGIHWPDINSIDTVNTRPMFSSHFKIARFETRKARFNKPWPHNLMYGSTGFSSESK